MPCARRSATSTALSGGRWCFSCRCCRVGRRRHHRRRLRRLHRRRRGLQCLLPRRGRRASRRPCRRYHRYHRYHRRRRRRRRWLPLRRRHRRRHRRRRLCRRCRRCRLCRGRRRRCLRCRRRPVPPTPRCRPVPPLLPLLKLMPSTPPLPNNNPPAPPRPRSPGAPVGAVTDQRAPQRRQEGRVDRVEQRTGYGRGAGGLGGRIRARARGQGLHKLDMKRRRLRAERLIGLAVRPKSRRDGHRHLIGARGQHRRRVGRGRGVGRPDRRTDACQIRGRCRDGLRRRDHKRYVTPPKRSWPNKPGQPGRDAQVFQRLMDRSALHRPTGSEIPGFPALLTDPWVFGSAR